MSKDHEHVTPSINVILNLIVSAKSIHNNLYPIVAYRKHTDENGSTTWLELIIEVSQEHKSICLEMSQYTGVKETIRTPEDMGNWMTYVRNGLIWDEAKDLKLVSRKNLRLYPQRDYMCGLAIEWHINDVMSKYFDEVPPMSSIAFLPADKINPDWYWDTDLIYDCYEWMVSINAQVPEYNQTTKTFYGIVHQ